MLSKNDLFRRINARFPDIVERLITLWGGTDLGSYINDTLSGVNGRSDLTEDVRFALASLKAEHDREFPQFSVRPPVVEGGILADNAEFKLVNSRFPRIGQRILATWGHSTFCDYVNELMNDKRDGRRQGFPEEIMLALFRLMQQHDKEFPQFVLKITDIWTLTNKM